MLWICTPEISAAGGLKKALDLEFNKINSPLRVFDDEMLSQTSTTYVRIENARKFSQIYMTVDKKLYLLDFWRDGVCLANGQTDNLAELAKVLNFWLCEVVTTKKLSVAFSFIVPNDKAIAFDEGQEVAYIWGKIQADSSRKELQAFINLAMNDAVLSGLFPFTSLNRLCFSKCTGYPYTTDTPIVVPLGDQQYEIGAADDVPLGRGTADEALRIIRLNLPVNIGPAIKGTAEDVK